MKKTIIRTTVVVVLMVSLVMTNILKAVAVNNNVEAFANNNIAVEEYIDTEFDGIKKSKDNAYAVEIGEGNTSELLAIGRLDVDILDNKQFEELWNRNDISDKLLEDIEVKREQMIQNGMTSWVVSIFSPEFLQSNTREIKYQTYNGTQMKSEFVYYTGCDTLYQTVSTGSGTISVAMSLTSIGFGYAGTVAATLPVVGSGISLFQLFESIYGSTWATGSTTDKLQIRVNYDQVIQYTSANVGGEWYTGLVTEKVTSNYVHSLQYYWNNEAGEGKSHTNYNYATINMQSPHYNNPWAVAYQNMYFAQTEWLFWKAGNKTFGF